MSLLFPDENSKGIESDMDDSSSNEKSLMALEHISWGYFLLDAVITECSKQEFRLPFLQGLLSSQKQKGGNLGEKNKVEQQTNLAYLHLT